MKLLQKLALLGIIAATANAGIITSIQSMTDAGISTEKRQLKTYGQNPRAYVFTVEEKDGAKQPMQCIIVYTEQDLGEETAKSTAPVLSCIKLGN